MTQSPLASHVSLVRRLLSAFTGALAGFAFLASAASAITIYDVTFADSVVGAPPPLGAGPFPRTTLSAVNFGTPTVVGSVGGLSQALLLNGGLNQGQLEQVLLDLGLLDDFASVSRYEIGLDLFIGSLGADDVAPSRFSILVDDPTSQSILFDGNGDIFLVRPEGQVYSYILVDHFAMGSLMRVEMVVDLELDTWTTSIDGAVLAVAPFGADDVQRLRISLQNLAGALGNQVAVDNIRVSAVVPEPAAALLLASALGALPRQRTRR